MNDDNPNEQFGNMPEDLDLSGGDMVDESELEQWRKNAAAQPEQRQGDDVQWIRFTEEPRVVRIALLPYLCLKHKWLPLDVTQELELGKVRHWYCTRHKLVDGDEVDTGKPCRACAILERRAQERPPEKPATSSLRPAKVGLTVAIAREPKTGDFAGPMELTSTAVSALLDLLNDPRYGDFWQYDVKGWLDKAQKTYKVQGAGENVPITDLERGWISDLGIFAEPAKFVARMIAKQGETE